MAALATGLVASSLSQGCLEFRSEDLWSFPLIDIFFLQHPTVASASALFRATSASVGRGPDNDNPNTMMKTTAETKCLPRDKHLNSFQADVTKGRIWIYINTHVPIINQDTYT